MEFISSTTKFDFLGKAPIAIAFSVLTIVGSIYLWVSLGSKKYGVDFVGGHELVVHLDNATSESVRAALEKTDLPEVSVQSFELQSSDFAIRMGGEASETEKVRTTVDSAIKAAFGEKAEIRKSDFVGPTIGHELRQRAILATALGLLAIMIYVAFRFEFAFALGAVVALFHDVIVSMGIFLLSGHSLGMSSLAAALTIIGYSVNDTIVIFDRVREELLRQKKYNIVELFNYCINLTLSRTIITHLLTLFSALALYLIGGSSIADLSLFLVAGIVAGTYSTIYIASPVAIAWHRFRGGKLDVE